MQAQQSYHLLSVYKRLPFDRFALNEKEVGRHQQAGKLYMNMKHSSKTIALFSLILLVATSSCQIANNSRSNGGGEANVSQSENLANTPQILFLNYSMRRNSAGTNELRFINKIVAEGQLKKEPQENRTYKVGDLRCVELDANAEPIKSTYVPNPLNRTVEYVNELGELSKKRN